MDAQMQSPLDEPQSELLRVVLTAKNRASSGTLPYGFVDALKEAQRWLDDPRPSGSAWVRGPWGSVLDDMEAGAQSLSNGVVSCVPAVAALRTHLRSQREAHTGEDAAARDAARRELRPLLKDALAQAATGASRRAAFMDLAKACARTTTSRRGIEQRAHTLFALTVHAGLNPDLVTTAAPFIIGGISPETGLIDPHAKPFRERIADMADLFARSPIEGRHVVWMFFAPAQIDFWKQEIGPITLFKPETIHSILDKHPEQYETLPEEIRTKSATGWFQTASSDQQVVAARIDLGTRQSQNAIADARRLAQLVVGVGQFGAATQHWRDQRKYLHFADGRSVEGRSELTESAKKSYSPYQDRVSYRLNHLNADGLERLLADFTDSPALADALSWWQDSRDASEGPRILLDVRILELVASRQNMAWDGYLRTQLRGMWLQSHLRTDMDHILQRLPEAATAEGRDELVEFMLKFQTPVNDEQGMIHVDYAYALSRLPELPPLITEGTAEIRNLRDMTQRLTRPAAFINYRTQALKDFDLLANRLRRIRCRRRSKSRP